MQPYPGNRRKEPRYEVEADATVHLDTQDEPVRTKTANLGASGVFLRFDQNVRLAVGDQVRCEFKIMHDHDEPLPYWAMGSVVRVTESGAAIELSAGGLGPVESATDASAQVAQPAAEPGKP